MGDDMNACQTPGCRRVPRQSSSGVVNACCDDCLRRLLRDAFGPAEPRSWHERARANQLPTFVVGGIAA